MSSRAYYLQLPEEIVPQVLFDQTVKARRVNVVFESESGHAYRIQATDDERVKLYSLNTTIGQAASDLTALVDECMRVRAELTGVAMHMGLFAEIPTATNDKTWISLGEAIHNRIHEAIGLKACSTGAAPTGKVEN